MKNSIVKTITRNAIVAAIYFLLTFAGSGFSFGPIQVRIAEALVLLCFFRRDYVFGLTIGCLLANLFSPIFPWDLLIGTTATLLSCLLISFMKNLGIAVIFPVIFNGFAVGAELFYLTETNFWMAVGFVGLGEFISVCIVGYLLFFFLKKNKQFMEVIGANRNLDVKW